jgi:ABC-type transporter MlaC component
MTTYDQYKNSEEWKIIQNAINELIQNQDIQLTTLPEYVIGYYYKANYREKKKEVIWHYKHYDITKYNQIIAMVILAIE